VWIEFMGQALKNVPVQEPPVPEGIVNVGGEWFYDEYAPGSGVSSLGMQSSGPASEPEVIPMPKADERQKILDLFKN